MERLVNRFHLKKNAVIKAFLKKSLQQVSPLFSLPNLIDRTGQNLFLPFYHTVGDVQNLPHIAHLYQPRSVKKFENDLDFLLKYFIPIDLDFLKNQEHLNQPKKNYFHLTFDDGLREFFDLVAPILVRKGIPATIFLNADFVDNQALFYRYKASLLADFLAKNTLKKGQIAEIQKIAPSGILSINFFYQNKLEEIAQLLSIDFSDFLQNQQPYLTTNQIKRLQLQGFTFGGHSLNHPLFSEITVSEQIRQATESVLLARHLNNQKTGAFAFPFTDFGVSNTFFNHIFQKQIIDISFGTAGLKKQKFPQHYQRFPMEGSNWKADDLIKTEYLYYLIKRVFGKEI